MSTHTERSNWSPEEIDSLDNIDKELQLVSTSSESQSVSNHIQENGSVNDVLDLKIGSVGQSIQNFVDEKPTKLSSSCDDLTVLTQENPEFRNNSEITRSSTFVNFKQTKKATNRKYDHVQSKIKQYFNAAKGQIEITPPKTSVITKIRENNDKEDYLEKINKQLTKELDEKNAILTLLQENYERLLFKYAEAQNRIDELRFKFMTESSESKNGCFKGKHCKSDNQISSCFHVDECGSKMPDIKCQKAIVAPFMKIEEPVDDCVLPISRPSSLPLDTNLKFVERDGMKATTPTDSEGLSSIITSMSGHSKILNSLDEENHINKKSNYIKFQTNDFVLEENSNLNDPFDKVKNWQNSLPPLEQIETPETALYNIFPGNAAFSSSNTKYKEISSPKKEFGFSDESCPDSWREEPVNYCRNNSERSKTEEGSKKISGRATLIPNRHKKILPSNHFREEDRSSKTDLTLSTKKRPPLLRCSSLPAYERDSPKSGNYKNGIYIPPLDLENVTLSDDESYCQQENYSSKSNAATSSSCVSSRGNSVDRSIQTPQSFSSCKATISEENSYPKVPRQGVSKSTSITPERRGAMETFFDSEYDGPRLAARIKECRECDNSRNRCNVCGESIPENRTTEAYRNKSNSCESVHNKESSRKGSGRAKPPFKRSVSFGSESLTPKFCSHENTPRNFFSRTSQESLENFDFYARSLKARSQVAMRAITAHVNNCTQ